MAGVTGPDRRPRMVGAYNQLRPRPEEPFTWTKRWAVVVAGVALLVVLVLVFV